MPPADVLVGATVIAGQPIARPLSSGAPAGTIRTLEADAVRLQYELDALRAAVIDLYGRLGYPMPNLDSGHHAEAPPSPRAASAG